MPDLAKLLFATSILLPSPLTALGQTADPFAGPPGSAADSFGGDPFGGGRPKSPAVRKPIARPNASITRSTPKAAELAGQGESPATIHLRAALDEKTTQTFINTPLQDAIRLIADTHDIPIIVDRRALEEIGLSVDEPVVLSLKNVSLRSFLRLMLRDLDLTYMIKDEVMQITTVEAAEQNLVVEMYKFPADLTDKSDKLLKALTSGVVPDAWESLGGPCSVTAIDNVLIVSATESIHEDVKSFLDKLRQAFEKHQAKSR
jgi:hypothetical protein